MNPLMLAEPITQLLSTFGSGNLGGAASGFAGAASSMGCAQESGHRGMKDASGWTGSSGEAATTTARTNQAQMSGQADRGRAIAGVVSKAADTVGRGKLDVQGVLDSFTTVATTLAPMLGLPSGQIALLKTAADHLGEAVKVVQGVNQQMASHTQDMTALASPAPEKGSRPVSAVADTGTGVAVTLPDGSTAMAPNEKAAAAVRSALGQQGVPYSWGGTTPAGFDCSGLTQYAYQQAGVDLPRMAADQAVGAQVSADQVMPGDLAVWDGHVAMVVGNGQMIEAGDPVEISPVRTDNQGEAFHGFYRPTA